MALALKSNITDNYRNLGKRPRIYIRIPSANIFIGTSLATLTGVSYTDSIADFDTITQSIEKYGGMAEVSGFGVRNLQLGSRFTLCTEAALTPQIEGYAGAGRLYAQGVADYLSARNATAASDIGSPAIVVGRRYTAGIPLYQVVRSYMQFSIPADMTSCEEATIEMTGVNKQTNQMFTIYAVSGYWTSLSTSMFNDFDGWKSSGDYTDIGNPLFVNLAETWTTAEFTQGTVNKIRLNTLGKNQVLLKADSTLKLMLLSSLDASNAAAPTADEYCQFDISGVVLRLRYNTITLDNQDAEVYLAYEPIPTAYTDMQLIWKGVVDDYSLDKSSLNLKLKQNDHKKNLTIPKKIVTIEDYPDCPDENLGKGYPIVYGDFSAENLHKDGVGYFLGEAGSALGAYQYGSIKNTFKPLMVKGKEPYQMLISGAKMKDSSNPFYYYDEKSTLTTLYPTKYTDISSGNGEVLIELETSDNYYPEKIIPLAYGYAQTIKPNTVTQTGGVVNGLNSYAENPALYAEMSASGQALYYYFINPKGWDVDINTARWTFIFYVELEAGNEVNVVFQRKLYNSQGRYDDTMPWEDMFSPAAYTIDATGYAYSFNALNMAHYFKDGNDIPLPDMRMIRVYITNGYDKSAKIKNVCILTGHNELNINKVTMSGQGYYDSTGLVTGTSLLLYENPAWVIKGFAVDEMGLSLSENNNAAFIISSVVLSSWKYAFQIEDRQGARNLLHNFFRQCRSKGLWDEQDRLSIKTFSASNHFAISGTDTPSGLDIFDTTGTPYLDQVTTNPIMDLQIDRTGLDEVKNDFVLKYRKNYATGDYLETLYMTNGLGVVGDVETNLSDSYLENSQTVSALSALCASSYSKYQTTNTLEFEADLIRDVKTASMLLQYLIERMYKRRYIVTVTTKDTGVRIEEGDFINIRDTRINDLFGETTANLKKWEVLRKIIGLNNMHFTFETIEVD